MPKSDNHDYFREPERNKLLNIVLAPPSQCPRYHMFKPEGAIPECEIGPVIHRDLMKWFRDLIALSDMKGQHRLRDALRTLHKHKVLKACMLQRILLAVKSGVEDDKNLLLAIEYEAVRLVNERRINKAQIELRTLKASILEKDFLRPGAPTLQQFTRYKTALSFLATNMLDALAELYEYEAMLTSIDVVKLNARVSRRQLTGKLLDDFCSNQYDKRWWNELAVLLDAGRAIYLEPDPAKAESHIQDSTNESLRQDVKKLSDEDVKKSKDWLEIIMPGLYDRIQNDPDQAKIIADIEGSEPRFSSLCSAMIRRSLEAVPYMS